MNLHYPIGVHHPTIDHRIFRAYDIRGRAHEQLTEEACFFIGKGFGTELRERYELRAPHVVVGRDARTHSPEFERAVIEGLVRSGCRVHTIGQTPSPVNYFTICTRELDGGIQVTASHNPAHDNGLKLSLRDAEAFAGQDLQHLRHRIEQRNLLHGQGTLHELPGLKTYLQHLETLFEGEGEGLTIVVDGGNGVAGPAYCEALRRVGAKVIELYTEPDGMFPNHPADPSKHETLRELQEAVRREGADCGLGYDGDGDRLGLVDEQGMIRSADEVLLLLAKDHLSRFANAPIVLTVSNSSILQSEIAAWGGIPILSKVGHSFVEHTMRKHKALLGGEQSGHFFVAEEYYGFDDALVASLRLLSILQQSGKSFSELCRDFPKVYQSPERRPHVADDHKIRIVEQAAEHFTQHFPVETLDGARIDFGDGAWAGIRYSNTSPSLSICIEARSPERLKEIEDIVFSHLKRYPEISWE